MSNLLKFNKIISQDERVIDYNQLIQSKIDTLRTQASKQRIDADGFVNGLDAKVVNELVSEEDEDGIAALTNDSDSDTKSAYIHDVDIEEATRRANEVVAQANEEATAIINDANNNASSIRQKAYTEGYDEGMVGAQNEINDKETQLQQEYDDKLNQLQQEYDDMKKSLEPELASTLLEVFSKVIHTIADDDKSMILSLVNSVMENAESSSNFVIKVSPDDYSFLANNQGKIYCAMSKDIQLDIVEDKSLEKNQCMIETDYGVFDCSLDIQLKRLISKIKILSSLN